MVLTFQNCSQFSKEMESTSSYSEETPISNHFSSSISQPQQKMRIVNRRYITELFRDIFTASNGQTADGLESYLFNWSRKRGAQLGGGCDLLESTTGVDCNNDFNNANQPSYADPNTIRESFKIQICEELLGQDNGLSIILGKVGYSANDPDPFSNKKIKAAYQLFFRTDEIPEYYLEAIEGFIFELKEKQESDLNIWRGIMLLLCESPDWQKI